MHIKRHMWKIDLQIVLVSVLALSAATFIPVDSAQARFRVRYAFGGSDGDGPKGALFRKAHNLYGANRRGGIFDHGTIFKLAADGMETVFHYFTGGDGASPMAA